MKTSNILIVLEKNIDSYCFSNDHTHRLNDLLVAQKHCKCAICPCTIAFR